jgi:hypothetical protein
MKRSLILPIFISFCHLFLFFFSFGQSPPKEVKRKITVRTIHLIEEPPLQFKEENILENKEIIAQKNPPKEIKKIEKPALIKKIPGKKVEKKKLQNAINKSLSKSSTPSKNTLVKKTVKKDAGKSLNEYNEYLQEVTDILTRSLTLPQSGKVKLAITVDQKGKVIKIVCLFSQSTDNLSYLEKNLVELSFPKYKTNEQRTFNITFKDEK